jgi:hypothetical protein
LLLSMYQTFTKGLSACVPALFHEWSAGSLIDVLSSASAAGPLVVTKDTVNATRYCLTPRQNESIAGSFCAVSKKRTPEVTRTQQRIARDGPRTAERPLG